MLNDRAAQRVTHPRDRAQPGRAERRRQMRRVWRRVDRIFRRLDHLGRHLDVGEFSRYPGPP